MAQDNKAQGETQLVVFDLASEFYGVDIGDVREIIRMQNVTRVPGTPVYMEGVINLRGKVVPVVDLRKRLDLKVKQQTKESRIVVVDIGGKDVGVIVDGVTEVLRIPLASVEPPSQMIANSDSAYIRGIAKLGDKLVILLDLDKVLAEGGYATYENESSSAFENKIDSTSVKVENNNEDAQSKGKDKSGKAQSKGKQPVLAA